MTVFSTDRLRIAAAMQAPLRVLRFQHHDPGRIRAILRRGWRAERQHRDPGEAVFGSLTTPIAVSYSVDPVA